ncbi:MAG: RIP metalloprotease RseP [Acidiferrobacteraceae bacterium]|jgi:regulator of sigma E protease|nr:RIP metalloprotease RseP [Acidiferrobacteraceae bacterium]MDP6552369.1 RIP metalloprotease RseP [Arenicellales bacterium]MDP6790344.1 RIP metalloprotease RseP [Arenicellales bacterium]MDP6918182.1 RIP metalloprotease RseP [Arenicellales bacterium]|tara:strand:+ start:38390 stop:39751 length:1362 start_codon:yes stop_codon:yes gene_type:complete
MDLFNNILFFLVAVAILVSFHEFGHFIVARWMGVRVLKFSVGFGKTVWRWQKTPAGTEYALGMIPLGGYVRMLDEREGEVSPGEREQAFNHKPLPKRSLIVLAGPAANLLLAVLLYWGIGLIGNDDLKPIVGSVVPGSPAEHAGFLPGDTIVSIDGRDTKGWSEHRLYLLGQVAGRNSISFLVTRDGAGAHSVIVDFEQSRKARFDPAVLSRVIGIVPNVPEPEARIAGLVAGGPADKAGLKVGDHILAINGEGVAHWFDLVEKISQGTTSDLTVAIERKGVTLEIPVASEASVVDGNRVWRIGIYGPVSPDLSEQLVNVRYPPHQGLVRAVETTWLMSVLTVRVFWQMLTGSASREHLSGPISIARFAGQSASLGLVQFLAFLAVLSVSLGIINLLPIPVLDGGHLVYFAAEGILGRPLPDQVFQWGQQFGIAFIVLLMALAFYNDFLSLLR